jgi:REP element-mobilizing transposase RayT
MHIRVKIGMGRSRYRFTEINKPHLLTCTVLHWIPVFTRPETVSILLDSLNHARNNGLKLYAYVILENHMHLIAQSDNLDKDINRLKSFTAKSLIRFLAENNVKTILDQLAFYKKAHKTDRAYQFWQEGVHPELIQDYDMMKQKVEYIHYNPVKRGYVDKPEHWRYSSARNYLGLSGLLDVHTDW